jgi:two-component system, NarL family, invasion response regulator UvrY
MSIKFLLADDHAIVRSGVKSLLKDAFPGTETEEAVDGESVMLKLATGKYNMIIMDIQMPNTDTVRLIKDVHLLYPAMPILILSMSPEKLYALRVLKAGARGFLSKNADPGEIKKAVDTILSNRRYISPAVAVLLADQPLFPGPDNPFDSLTPREREICFLLLEGKNVSDIAKTLGIKVSTTSTHKAKIFEKLNASNLFELKEIATLHNL